MEENKLAIRPQAGPQELFLSTPADIAIYGGAAGGGKTFALLLENLRHINNKNFGSVIFRRQASQISNEGGLWDEALGIYPLLGAKPKETPRPSMKFPSGATISFAHLQYEKDVRSWDGSQIALICFDELIHFTKRQFIYMLSRNRSTCGIKPYIRATTNPDADSWVASFISWWIDQKTGYPIPKRSGVLRYFIPIDDEFKWADSKEALIKTYKADPTLIKSVTFIASSVYDNKILLAKDPGYIANLNAMSQVEKERLLHGNWIIRPAAGLYFKRTQVKVVDKIPGKIVSICRAWDLAATEISAGNEDPDRTAGVLEALLDNGSYIVLDAKRGCYNSFDVLLSLVDKFSKPMVTVTGKTKQAERQFKNTQNTVNKFASGANNKFLGLVGTMGKLAGVAATLGGVLTIGGIISASEKWLSLAKDQVEAETKLEAVLKNVASIQAVGGEHYKTVKNELIDYAGELQNLGVVGDEVTLSGMQQLAAFQLNGEQIKTLSGGMLDLLVQQKGLNGSQEDAVTVAKMIGKAMDGQVTAFSKAGISMTEAEQAAIKYGDANQRAATIAGVLKRSVGGMNEAMAQTDDGKAQQAMNNYGDMLENFGKKLMPIRAKLWTAFGKMLPFIEEKAMVVFDLIGSKVDELAPLLDATLPKVIEGISEIVDTAFTAFGVLGEVLSFLYDNSEILLPIIGGLVAGFTAFNLAVKGALILKTIIGFMQGVAAAGSIMNFVLAMNPLGLLAVAIGVLIAALIYLYRNWDAVTAKVLTVWNYLKAFGNFLKAGFVGMFEAAFALVQKIFASALDNFWQGIAAVKGIFLGLLGFLGNVFTGNWSGAWQKVVNIFSSLFTGLTKIAKTPLNAIIDMVNKVIKGINSISFAVPSWVPGLGGKTVAPNLSQVPNFATGTSYFQGGLAEVNEDGRGELINLPSGAQIVPHDKSMAAATKTPTVNVSVIVQGNVIGNEEYANWLGNIILGKLKGALANI